MNMNPENNPSPENNISPEINPSRENTSSIESNTTESGQSPEVAWAERLGLNYDPEEAQRRAEKLTPPPTPGSVPPPTPHGVPAQDMQAFGGPDGQLPPQNSEMNPASPYGAPQPMPPTYLVWSVVALVCCCFIPAIIAIIYSAKVSSKYYAGDYAGAVKASERAQIWIIVAIVSGLVVNTLYMPFSLLIG